MYLAALVGQNPYVSTYFIAILDPVGGGGTHKKAHVEKHRQKSKVRKTSSVPPTLSLYHFDVC